MPIRGTVWRPEVIVPSGNKPVRVARSIDSSWRTLLPAVGPLTFTGEFGPMHEEFWDWYWMTVNRRRAKLKLSLEEQVYLAIWSRGMGKSVDAEWATILEGGLIGEGYVLYVCGTQDLAKKHLYAIQERLESSEVATYYPGLASPKITKYGKQAGWKQDFLHTKNGWGVTAYGLDQGVRGGRLGEKRVTMIVLDDIDDLDDSPEMVQKKINTIARSVLPTGTKGTIVIFAQNLIHTNSVLNQILTNRADLLNYRMPPKIWPAMEGLRTERQGLHDVIIAGTPTWKAFDMEACQEFLAKSGLKAFLAEYQHDLKASEEGLIIPEYDKDVHIITWSEFQRVFGIRDIPSRWIRDVACDWGATGLEAHPTILSAIATSGEESFLPNMHFLYYGKSFDEGVLVDDVAETIRVEVLHQERRRDVDPLLADPMEDTSLVRAWRMSHEAKTERDTFRRKFGIPFVAGNASKTAGIAMWRHYMHVDYKREHPFRPGAKGYSYFYWIVEDDQFEKPVDDRGLARHRKEIENWKWRPTKLTDAGLSKDQPVKFLDDACDSIRFLTDKWFPPPVGPDPQEQEEKSLPEALRIVNTPADIHKREGMELHRLIALGKLRRAQEEKQQRSDVYWLEERE